MKLSISCCAVRYANLSGDWWVGTSNYNAVMASLCGPKEKAVNKDELLADLHVKSSEFAEKATKLSNLLLEAEEFLNRLPGKIHVTVVDDGGNSLQFDRAQDGWGFFCLRTH